VVGLWTLVSVPIGVCGVSLIVSGVLWVICKPLVSFFRFRREEPLVLTNGEPSSGLAMDGDLRGSEYS
jgi:hypothetical protein